MEKEKTDSAKFEKKNISEEKLSDEHLFLKRFTNESLENIGILSYIIFFLSLLLIYLIGFLRRFVTWIIFELFNMFEFHPNLLTFTLQVIGITKIIFKSDKSKYNFLFGFIIAYLTNYVLNKIQLLYFLEFIVIYIAKFLKKIYFIFHILLSFALAWLISFLVEVSLEIFIFIKKIGKIYTSNDKEYIMKLLEANESLFILYSEIYDPNNKFYKEELSKISGFKKGKYTFIMINYFSEFDKYLYSLIFNEKSAQPKFGFKKGNIKKLMKQFPAKENFIKDILDFVDKQEFEEFNKEVNKNETNNKEELKKEEEKKEEERDKDKGKEENKKRK